MPHHKASWCLFGEAGQRQLDSLHKIMGDYDHQLNALQQSATELTATQPALQTGNPFFEKLSIASSFIAVIAAPVFMSSTCV